MHQDPPRQPPTALSSQGQGAAGGLPPAEEAFSPAGCLAGGTDACRRLDLPGQCWSQCCATSSGKPPRPSHPAAPGGPTAYGCGQRGALTSLCSQACPITSPGGISAPHRGVLRAPTRTPSRVCSQGTEQHAGQKDRCCGAPPEGGLSTRGLQPGRASAGLEGQAVWVCEMPQV